ncbi:hypothetical protein U0070_016122 [Myodes glareolus]|uniref:Uncharacterized protein n=1 Tax=Myodes glareolus TaxID=447135 RepID=A0AAW0IE84_MYOGA
MCLWDCGIHKNLCQSPRRQWKRKVDSFASGPF